MAANTENRYASIYINGNAAEDTLKSLRDSSRKLKNEMDKLPRSGEEFAKKAELLREVEERLVSLRNEAKGVGKAFQNMSEEIQQSGGGGLNDLIGGKVAGMLGWGAVAAGVLEGGRKVISQNAELSDSLAGVMKTTGLAQVEVESLDRALSKLNTRTAKSELLGLAQVAGKLGISDLKEVEGFVRAADMIGVALGEDLGGTEQAVTSLGKLADIFKLTEEYGIEEALLKIGSAINSLGASGTANEAYMIDFANRLAGIAPAANVSMGDVLGLAATLDSLGQSGEKSSTAIGKFFVEMGANSAKFAKIAKMEVSDFNKLLQEDANEAFLRVLESSNATSGGIVSLAKSMNALEIKDSGAVQALGALAKNIDKVREAQLLGNEELNKGTSIITEFDTVNNNLAGNLEKLGKIMAEVWENGKLRGWLTSFTGWIVNAKSDVENLTDAFDKQKTIVAQLDKDINPLLTRYDELKTKGKLSKDEQTELHAIIQKIADYIPTSVSQWNQFGQAMDINRGKVNEFAEAQRELLQVKNRDAIDDLQDLYKSSTNMAEIMAKRANDAQAHSKSNNRSILSRILGFDEKDIKTSTKIASDQTKIAYESLIRLSQEFGVKLDSDQEVFLKKYRERNNLIQKEAKKVSTTVTGDDGDGTGTGTGKTGTGTGTVTGGGSTTTKKGKTEAERDAEKAKESYDKLLKEDEAFKEAMAIADDSWYKQQLAKEAEQYNKQISAWKEFLEKKGLTDKQKEDANSKVKELESAKDGAIANKKIKLEEELVEKVGDLRSKLTDKLLTERSREEKSINEYYDALAEKYKGNEDMQVVLAENRAADLQDAKIREEERFHKEAEILRKEADLSKLTDAEKEELSFKQKMDSELQALREKYTAELQETELFKEAEQAIVDRYANLKAQREAEVEKKKREDIKRATIDAAQNVSDALFSIGANNRDRELQTVLTKLDTERERELSAKNLTEAQKKRINEKYDALEKKEKERAWKAQQKADIIQAGINTALAVTRALPNWVNAAAVGVAGAAQIAMIASQKVPQFFHGGFTGDEPKGWVRKPTVFTNSASGRAFSAGENHRGEYVISSSQLMDPLVADFVAMMESGRNKDISSLTPQPTIIQSSVDLSALENKMEAMIKAYVETQDKKVVLVYQDLEDAQEKKTRIQFSANS